MLLNALLKESTLPSVWEVLTNTTASSFEKRRKYGNNQNTFLVIDVKGPRRVCSVEVQLGDRMHTTLAVRATVCSRSWVDGKLAVSNFLQGYSFKVVVNGINSRGLWKQNNFHKN